MIWQDSYLRMDFCQGRRQQMASTTDLLTACQTAGQTPLPIILYLSATETPAGKVYRSGSPMRRLYSRTETKRVSIGFHPPSARM